MIESRKFEDAKNISALFDRFSVIAATVDAGIRWLPPDGKFKPAVVVNKSHKGNFAGKELVVKADGVAQPCAIRYLHSKPWIGSLYSFDSGLPLGPFEIRF